MHRWLQQDVGGTLYTDELEERADASPTFAVLSPSGGSLATGTATRDSVNTTLASGASAGAATLSLTSAASVVVGRRYRVGGAELTGGETVTIKSLSGTTATLVRPLLRAAASGASFDSTRLSVAVSAAACATIGRHHRVVITYLVSAATRPTVSIPFDVTKYGLTSGLTFEHLRDLDPLVAKRASEGLWWPAIREAAWDMIVTRVAGKVDPGAMVGTIEMQRPHAYAAMLLILDTLGTSEESRARQAWAAERLGIELDAVLGAAAIDANQDGVIERHEQWLRGINLTRG